MDEEETLVMLQQILTPESRKRLERITGEHPDLVETIEEQLIALAGSVRRNRRKA